MKILIIQLRRIGDIIVTTPVIGALREAFPDAVIDFLSEPMGEPVLRGQPGLNEAILFRKEKFFSLLAEIRRRRYDCVLDFLNTPRSAQIVLASGAGVRVGFDVPFWGLVYNRRVRPASQPKYIVEQKFDLLRALGLNPRPALPGIRLAEEDFVGAKGWWEKNELSRFRNIVGLAPAHRRAIRQWPEEKWAGLIPLLLSDEGRAMLLFGGPGEESLMERLAAPFPDRAFPVPTGPLRQAASVMSRCRAVVSNCSGSMHLAVASGVPTVTIYGPTMPEVWNPRRPPHRYVRAHGLACLGCHLDVCPYKHECMDWISPERVAGEVEAVLS
jgi:lipopolysaccharide heptosyltransferase II